MGRRCVSGQSLPGRRGSRWSRPLPWCLGSSRKAPIFDRSRILRDQSNYTMLVDILAIPNYSLPMANVIDERHPAAADLRLSKVLAALADTVRLATVRTLAGIGDTPCTELHRAAGLQISRSTFSHHQRICAKPASSKNASAAPIASSACAATIWMPAFPDFSTLSSTLPTRSFCLLEQRRESDDSGHPRTPRQQPVAGSASRTAERATALTSRTCGGVGPRHHGLRTSWD